MAITGASLLQENGGELSRATFPEFSAAALDTQLDVWAASGNDFAVSAGLSSPEDDLAASCYAYYLAYLSVFQRLAATPQTTSLEGQGTVTLGSSQADRFKKLADEKLACANSYANMESGVPENTIPPTTSVQLNSTWGVR